MIDTQIWETNPDKPGYLRYVGQVPLYTILAGIRAALDAMPMPDDPEYTVLYNLEWISGPHAGWYGEPPKEELWPKGEPIITVKRGSNEGYQIVILSLGRDGTAKQLFTIKSLLGRDVTWTIAQALDKHFEIH